MVLVKAILSTFLLMQILNISYCQEFSFFIYFEDCIGNRDSLELGYDENGNQGIDEQFEENNILDQPYNDLFDVRVTDEIRFRQLGENQGTYHTKKEIVRKTYGEIIAIDIKSNNYPITASWDSTLFQEISISGTLITSTPQGGWWDVGSPSDLGKVILMEQSQVTFTDNIRSSGQIYNTYAYVQGVDTISVFWFVFGPEGIGVSTDEMKEKKDWFLFPNPSRDRVHIQNINGAKAEKISILNCAGNIIKEGHPDQISISLNGLDSGLYIVEIIDINGVRIIKKLLVIE